MTGPSGTSAARRVLPTIDLGSGDPVVIMQGFALQPRTYLAVAELLAERCRVIIPPLFAESGWHWSPDRVLDDLEATLDHLGVGAVTMIGHSFGGALELNFAVQHPERITELVFADTLAMAHEWSLAAEAVRPTSLVWMATPRAAIDFTTSFLTHPLCLAQAGWWGFRSDRHDQVATIAASGIPCHVLWADPRQPAGTVRWRRLRPGSGRGLHRGPRPQPPPRRPRLGLPPSPSGDGAPRPNGAPGARALKGDGVSQRWGGLPNDEVASLWETHVVGRPSRPRGVRPGVS